MKKFVNLDKKWKEILYAASGFGPNLLMILMGCYFTDALNPTALSDGSFIAMSNISLILPAVFPVLWTIAKAFDGIVDIPLAALTDNLKTKWGRRRLPIAICFIPMVVSYLLCWMPISQTNQIANTIWITCWALVFFTTYTMCLIAFYGSLSTVCATEKQRLRVSSYKSFFDTITYCIVYALIPVIADASGLKIHQLAYIMLPMMATMLIPLFIIKEGDKFEKKAIAEGYDITPLAEEERVGILESMKLTFINKPFWRWCVVNCCSFFGLQMFLAAMEALIIGGMGLSGTQMAILNTCAFAPVPLMLYLFNKLKDKKGIRFAYQTCLLSFGVCILSFVIGSKFVLGEGQEILKVIIGCIGGVIGSWAIGSFFMMPYLIPAQISSVEEKLTNKNHSAMYFAGQALTTSIVGAIAGGLVYENIKMLFISKENWHITYAEATETLTAIQVAANKLGVDAGSVYNFGLLLVPIIVSVFCLLGFALAFGMPKNYTPDVVAKQMGLEKEYNEHIDLFNDETKVVPFEEENQIVNIALWVLTGSIFGIVWRYGILSKSSCYEKKSTKIWMWILTTLVFPLSCITTIHSEKAIVKMGKEHGLELKDNTVLLAILSAIGLEFVAQIIMQHQLNKIAKTF